MDWYAWHEGYQDGRPLRRRLRLVQDQLRAALTEAPAGPVEIISVCAGQGHDVIGVLADSPRRSEVRALLVELDERNVAAARLRIAQSGLTGIEVRQADAGITDSYRDATPAGIVLTCGVYGSLTDDHVDRAVAALPGLCAEGAQVIWTAHRSTPGLYATVAAAFERHGFVPVRSDPDDPFGVTRHRLGVPPRPLRAGERMFRFADEPTLISIGRIQTE